MMPTSKKSFLATAALAFACSLFVPRPPAAQDAQGTADDRDAAAAQPAAGLSAMEPSPAPAVGTTTAAEPAPTAPPRNLRKVGDHWTPYNPPDPESFPPDATLHIIVPGETLWGLSDLTYNNPYLWPQLWDRNRYITDSHWIYPGDPLLVPPRPVVVTPTGERAGVPTEIVPLGQDGAPNVALDPMVEPGSEETGSLEEPLAAETASPQPAAGGSPGASSQASTGDSSGGVYPGGVSASTSLVDRDDLRCAGYITEDDKRGDLYIAENDEPHYENVGVGSLLYLNRGRDDARVVPGAVFSVIVREGTVLHPATGRTQGTYYSRTGEVRVLKVLEDTAIATVVFACDEIRVGDELTPADVQPVPARAIPPFDPLRVERNGKPTGYLIHTRDSAVHVATGAMAQVDLGREDGLAPGDFLTAFAEVHADRKHVMPDYDYKFGNEVFRRPDMHEDDPRTDYPQVPVAQMIVVTAGAHTSTVKIVFSLREIAVGAMVEVD